MGGTGEQDGLCCLQRWEKKNMFFKSKCPLLPYSEFDTCITTSIVRRYYIRIAVSADKTTIIQWHVWLSDLLQGEVSWVLLMRCYKIKREDMRVLILTLATRGLLFPSFESCRQGEQHSDFIPHRKKWCWFSVVPCLSSGFIHAGSFDYIISLSWTSWQKN